MTVHLWLDGLEKVSREEMLRMSEAKEEASAAAQGLRAAMKRLLKCDKEALWRILEEHRDRPSDGYSPSFEDRILSKVLEVGALQ